MGRKPEITELPTRFVMAQLGSGRRWKRIVAIAVVGLAAAGGAGFYLLKNMEAGQAAALKGEWSTLQGCVLGEPLKANESPETRVRAIQLTVLGTPRDQRTKAGELGWPANCSAAASTLSEHAESAPAGGAELKASSATLAKAMRENANATSDVGKLVDQVWKDAASAGLKSEPTSTQGVPVPSVALFAKDVLRAPSGLGGEFAVASLKPDPTPTKGLRFLVDDNGLVGGAVLCTASGIPTALGCKHVAADVAKHTPGLSLEGTTDPEAQPWIFAGERGQLGIFRPAGTVAITGDTALGSSVDKDGSAWILIHPAAGGATEVLLTHAPLTGDVPRGRPAFDDSDIDSLADATLYWDWILERTGPKAHPPLHLVGRRLSDKGDIGPLVDIGDAANLEHPDRADKQERFSACRSGNNIAVRIHGVRADAIAFFTGTAWTAPLPVATRGGTLACHGNEAVVTQISRVTDSDGSHPTVEQSRCNASGCTATRLPIREMLSGTDVVPQESGSFTAADLGGKTLLVWSAGPLGGLRMRLATLDRMKATPDTLIVDTREDNGQSSVTELRLLSTTDGAILFVNTTTGARLFNVDGTGKLSELHTHA
jgi:hypothetical protein